MKIKTLLLIGLLLVVAALSPLTAQAAATEPAEAGQANGCPPSEVRFGPYYANPAVYFLEQYPDKPLVAGQDDGVGVSGVISIHVGGVTVKSYTAEDVYAESAGCYCDHESCVDVPAGNGGAECFDENHMGGHWYTAGQLIGHNCTAKYTDYTDRVTSVGVWARMTPESQEWIKEGLSVRYPEANVRQLSYDVMPYSTLTSFDCNGAFGSTTCSLSYNVNGLQIFDPGQYRITYTITTMGTPATLPRTLIGTAVIAVPPSEQSWFGPALRDYFEVYVLSLSGR